MTSSIFEPVSMSAVARIVRLPPSSILRAAPKKTLRTLQRVGVHAAGQHLAGGRHHGVVGAREPGDRIQAGLPRPSCARPALGLLDDHLRHLHVPGGGLIEGARHTSPFTVRCISVTSSGRSSMSSTMRMTSGWLEVMAVAMFCSSIVLPAFGGTRSGRAGPCQWARPVDGARGQILGGAVAAFELQTLGRMERRQFSNSTLWRELSGES